MLILLVSDPFGGKTVSGASFIEACAAPNETLLDIDIDDGFSSVQNSVGVDGKLVVPRYKEIIVEKLYKPGFREFHMKTPEKNDFSSKIAPSYTESGPVLVQQMNNVFNELYTNQGMYKGKRIKVFMIDSLSGLIRIWKDGVIWTNKAPGLRIGDYNTLEGMLFSQLIPTLKGLKQFIPWIIVTNHLTVDKDDLVGSIQEHPVGPSASQGRLIAKEFDEVWKMTNSGKVYGWDTKPGGFFKGGGSRLDLPKEVKPATYKQLKYILDSRGGS